MKKGKKTEGGSNAGNVDTSMTISLEKEAVFQMKGYRGVRDVEVVSCRLVKEERTRRGQRCATQKIRHGRGLQGHNPKWEITKHKTLNRFYVIELLEGKAIGLRRRRGLCRILGKWEDRGTGRKGARG